jgi:hypothetical protein
MTVAEWIASGKDVVIAVAAAVTAAVAVFGVNKWRQELHGKTNFDAARALIRSTYRLRDEIKNCRWSYFPNAEHPPGYDGSETADTWRYMYKKRWDRIVDCVQDFDSSALEAEALWGTDIRTKAQALRDCVGELQIAIDTFLTSKTEDGAHLIGTDFLRSNVFPILWVRGGGAENDAFGVKIVTTIKDIEADLVPHLRSMRQPSMRNNNQGWAKENLAVVSSIVAAAFAGLAAVFTGMQWYEAHEQRLIGSRPSVTFDVYSDVVQKPVGLSIKNAGPGVAELHSIVYYVDRKPVKDLAEALTLANLDPDKNFGVQLDPDEPITPNDPQWVLDYKTKDKAELIRAADFIETHLTVDVTFCTLGGHPCWSKCSSKGSLLARSGKMTPPT